MTAEPKIYATDAKAPLIKRIRLVYQPGMTVNDLAVKTRGKVEAIKKAVQKLRAEGFIKESVAHTTRADVVKAMPCTPLLTAAQRASFRREVSADMLAQIAAFPASKITKCDPSGQKTFFGQALGGRGYPSMEA